MPAGILAQSSERAFIRVTILTINKRLKTKFLDHPVMQQSGETAISSKGIPRLTQVIA